MARRSRQSFLKRQRERQRAEKAAEKRQKRFERHRGTTPEEAGEEEGEGEPGLEGQLDPSADGEPGLEEQRAAVSAGAETADGAPDQSGTPPDRQD